MAVQLAVPASSPFLRSGQDHRGDGRDGPDAGLDVDPRHRYHRGSPVDSGILDKTTLNPDQVGEYSGEAKEIRPVTVATYQILTYRRHETRSFAHFALFDSATGASSSTTRSTFCRPRSSGPRPLQARRRLGLTATLVREDGREDDVFALIGPKKYDVPWKELEKQGWIATAACTEIRLPLPAELRMTTPSPTGEKYRDCLREPRQADVCRILARHAPDPTLVIGMYLEQLRDSRGTGHTGHHRPDAQPNGTDFSTIPRAIRKCSRFPRSPTSPSTCPTRGGNPGLGDLRLPAGRGPAAGADPAAQAGHHQATSTPLSPAKPLNRISP